MDSIQFCFGIRVFIWTIKIFSIKYHVKHGHQTFRYTWNIYFIKSNRVIYLMPHFDAWAFSSSMTSSSSPNASLSFREFDLRVVADSRCYLWVWHPAACYIFRTNYNHSVMERSVIIILVFQFILIFLDYASNLVLCRLFWVYYVKHTPLSRDQDLAVLIFKWSYSLKIKGKPTD